MKTYNIPEDFGIINYTWRNAETGKVLDCHQNVDLHDKNLTKLPFKFGIVEGYFDCAWNHLTSLKCSPEIVKGSFWCQRNNLTSLKGCPEIVGGNFSCSINQLTSLEYGPKEVKGKRYWCYHNKLITLKGAPINLKGKFYCNDNPSLPEDENTYEKYIRKLKIQKILEL